MPTTAILTPSKYGGFNIFDPETATSNYGQTEEEAVANLRADIEYHQNNPLDVEWVRAKLAEGLASGVCNQKPEDILREIMAKKQARRATDQASQA
jgi:hypothetical protein